MSGRAEEGASYHLLVHSQKPLTGQGRQSSLCSFVTGSGTPVSRKLALRVGAGTWTQLLCWGTPVSNSCISCRAKCLLWKSQFCCDWMFLFYFSTVSFLGPFRALLTRTASVQDCDVASRAAVCKADCPTPAILTCLLCQWKAYSLHSVCV